MKQKIIVGALLSMLSSAAFAQMTLDDVNRNLDTYDRYVPPQSEMDDRWTNFNRVPESATDGDLEAQVSTNGYVVLNQAQGLIKQWGRINLPANSLGQRWISFPKRMKSVFSITVSSSDPYTSSSCRNCVIETDARVKNYNSSGFNITNGFVGDGKGGVYAVTLYWEATGKL